MLDVSLVMFNYNLGEPTIERGDMKPLHNSVELWMLLLTGVVQHIRSCVIVLQQYLSRYVPSFPSAYCLPVASYAQKGKIYSYILSLDFLHRSMRWSHCFLSSHVVRISLVKRQLGQCRLSLAGKFVLALPFRAFRQWRTRCLPETCLL